jgi:hypothetical protein
MEDPFMTATRKPGRPRKSPARHAAPPPGPAPAEIAADPATFGDLWETLEPGSRLSKGVYSIYKTAAGGLHIAYRRDGDEHDSHLPVPPAMVAMMIAASEGKGPLGRIRALAGTLAGP